VPVFQYRYKKLLSYQNQQPAISEFFHKPFLFMLSVHCLKYTGNKANGAYCRIAVAGRYYSVCKGSAGKQGSRCKQPRLTPAIKKPEVISASGLLAEIRIWFLSSTCLYNS
jgi:hypothetical protein